MKNVSKIVQLALALLGVIFFVMIITGSSENSLSNSGATGLNGAIWITLISIVVGFAAALIFGVVNLISKGAKAKGTILGIVGFGVLVAACFAMATSDIPAGVDPALVDEMTSKRVSAGINLFLVLFGESNFFGGSD